MPKYQITLRRQQDVTVTVLADTAPAAEVMALEEALTLPWPRGRVTIQSTRRVTTTDPISVTTE